MMGRSHILSGLIAGVTVAGVLPAPLPVRLLVVPVAGGAALLPDLDHRSSRIARSLGPITKALAAAVNGLSLAIYDGTATDEDPEKRDGHRTATHTIPGCLAWGLGLLLVGVAGPWAVRVAELPARVAGLPYALCLAVLIGLMGSGLKVLGFGFAAVATLGSWWVTTTYSGWWWLWPLVVVVGSLSHVLGDAWTSSGVPLAWPFVVGGQRWYRVRAPRTFSTGTTVETTVVTPLLYFGLIAVTGLATGFLPVLVGVVAGVLRG
jgi:membrane-bound metal-dependent hydrolase YbcI (DUF457 family)